MVAIRRNSRRQGAAEYFGEIELLVPGVGTRYENAADGVSRTVQEASLSRLKITRILAQQRRQNRARHEVRNGPISGVRTESLSIAFRSLSITSLAILGLADARQKGIPGQLHRIERAAGHHLELLFSGEWRNLIGILQGQEVRQRVEESIL